MLAAAGVAALVDWIAVGAERRNIEAVAKPLVMVFLLAAALGSTDPVRGWIAVALAFGLLGDVLLLPALDRFVGGLAAFLVGHLVYAAGFVVAGVSGRWYVAGAVLAAVLVGGLGRPIIDAVRASRLRGPVTAYIAAIGVMVAAAVGTGSWWFGAGAIVFALSDALLGHDRFVTPRTDRRVLVHVLYHGGQAAIVAGLAGVWP